MKVKHSVTSIGVQDEPQLKSKILAKFSHFKNPFKKVNTGVLLAVAPIAVFVIANVALISFLAIYLNGGVKLSAKASSDLQPAYNVYTSKPKTMDSFKVEAETVDARVEKVRLFFEKYNAPLKDYADVIVETSDKYNVDWRLISAIGYCEGNGGKAIPEGSYNTWGWAASQKDLEEKSGRYHLGSWEQAIETVTRGLKKGYIDQGLETPEQIMPKYAPPSVEKGGPWAKCVNKYMQEIAEIN